MNINKEGLELIKTCEGLKLNAYLDSIKLPTIGIGTTIYPNGVKVKMGDKITEAQALEYLAHDLDNFENGVTKLLGKTVVSPNQFSALVSFAYNLGLGALGKSTLLKKVLANPNDASIADEFLKWNKAGGVVVNGLTTRRKLESALYFKK
jgi:lysozyme